MIDTRYEQSDEPDMEPLVILETALDTACHSLAADHAIPDLDQEWLPPWRLPQTGHGWVAQWIVSAACELRQALLAYRHSYDHQRQLRLLPDPYPDERRPS
jgi:hypothetical protein